jgi:hypothetical protein
MPEMGLKRSISFGGGYGGRVEGKLFSKMHYKPFISLIGGYGGYGR